MHKLKSLSLVALAALGLSAYGGTTTNEWWNVDFESPTPGGWNLEVNGSYTNAMNVLGLRSEWQYVVKGAIIIAAVAISALAAKIAAVRALSRQRQEALAEQKKA